METRFLHALEKKYTVFIGLQCNSYLDMHNVRPDLGQLRTTFLNNLYTSR